MTDEPQIIAEFIALTKAMGNFNHRLYYLKSCLEKLENDQKEVITDAVKVINRCTTPSFIIKEKEND